jgi:hypothetical protein
VEHFQITTEIFSETIFKIDAHLIPHFFEIQDIVENNADGFLVPGAHDKDGFRSRLIDRIFRVLLLHPTDDFMIHLAVCAVDVQNLSHYAIHLTLCKRVVKNIKKTYFQIMFDSFCVHFVTQSDDKRRFSDIVQHLRIRQIQEKNHGTMMIQTLNRFSRTAAYKSYIY